MKIIPAIDIMEGEVVRLTGGDPNRKKVYSEYPEIIARRFVKKHAQIIHIVDLDGAFKGYPVNTETIRKIKNATENKAVIEVGGGIRTLEDVEKLKEAGADWLVITTMFVENPELFKEICEANRGKIVAGIDARNGKLSIKGWTEDINMSPVEAAKRVQELGASRINFTDITKDGTMEGINIDTIKEVVQSVDIPVVTSGGVSSMDDIFKLMELEPLGLDGIIIGKALYEKKLNFSAFVV